jgi:membrane protease subunit HflC
MAFDKTQIPDAFPPPGWKKTNRGGMPKLSPLAMLTAMGLSVVALTGIGMAVTGKLGLANVSPEQVAVKVNYLTGSLTPITTAGYQFFLPFVQELYILDKRPQNFVMQGTRYEGGSVVPYLTVRANDGSNFRFDNIEIQYGLIPSEVDETVRASGPGDNYKQEWVKSFARSILRDEFGRYSAEQIANPSTLQMAFAESRRRLDEALQPFGLQILAIPQQKPNFDAEYEQAIEDRKVVDQDVERLVAMADQLKRERDQRLAAVEKDKSIELAGLLGELDRLRLEAERDATLLRRAADAYQIERVSQGTSQRAEMLARARGLVEKYTKEAEGVEAQATALGQQGEVVVREALIQRLAGIRFTLAPYSKDPSPARIEYEDKTGSAPRPAPQGGQ